MKYIKQIGADVIVNTKDFVGNIEDHPSIKENPDLFEIVDELPQFYDTLNYQSNIK